MICMERLSESDKGGRADVKNYDEDYIVSCDRAVMACGIGMFGSGRAVRYYIPTDGRSFHTLRCFELWLRKMIIGGIVFLAIPIAGTFLTAGIALLRTYIRTI